MAAVVVAAFNLFLAMPSDLKAYVSFIVQLAKINHSIFTEGILMSQLYHDRFNYIRISMIHTFLDTFYLFFFC